MILTNNNLRNILKGEPCESQTTCALLHISQRVLNTAIECGRWNRGRREPVTPSYYSAFACCN